MSAERPPDAGPSSPELARIVEASRSRSRQIARFYERLRLRRVPELDRLFREAHERAFAAVDCLQCGACCRWPGPRLTTADVSRLAEELGVREAEVARRWLRTDEDRDLVFGSLPCPFLAPDGLCSVYAARPRACREYPHTDRKGMARLLRITARNALLCPAVALITEELIARLGP